MSRSVSYPSGCAVICFRDVTGLEELEWEWDEWIDDLKREAQRHWPTMERVRNKWLGREDRAILENRFAYIGVSEYCGLAAIWLKPKDDPMAAQWCANIGSKFRRLFGELVLMAVTSNGEALYEQVQTPEV